MKKKTILKLIMMVIFIVLLPLILIEQLINKSSDIFSSIRLSYQMMLFVVNLGCQKQNHSH
jgi:inner membrane protein involved in colicin E2 resistance